MINASMMYCGAEPYLTGSKEWFVSTIFKLGEEAAT